MAIAPKNLTELSLNNAASVHGTIPAERAAALQEAFGVLYSDTSSVQKTMRLFATTPTQGLLEDMAEELSDFAKSNATALGAQGMAVYCDIVRRAFVDPAFQAQVLAMLATMHAAAGGGPAGDEAVRNFTTTMLRHGLELNPATGALSPVDNLWSPDVSTRINAWHMYYGLDMNVLIHPRAYTQATLDEAIAKGHITAETLMRAEEIANNPDRSLTPQLKQQQIWQLFEEAMPTLQRELPTVADFRALLADRQSSMQLTTGAKYSFPTKGKGGKEETAYMEIGNITDDSFEVIVLPERKGSIIVGGPNAEVSLQDFADTVQKLRPAPIADADYQKIIDQKKAAAEKAATEEAERNGLRLQKIGTGKTAVKGWTVTSFAALKETLIHTFTEAFNAKKDGPREDNKLRALRATSDYLNAKAKKLPYLEDEAANVARAEYEKALGKRVEDNLANGFTNMTAGAIYGEYEKFIEDQKENPTVYKDPVALAQWLAVITKNVEKGRLTLEKVVADVNESGMGGPLFAGKKLPNSVQQLKMFAVTMGAYLPLAGKTLDPLDNSYGKGVDASKTKASGWKDAEQLWPDIEGNMGAGNTPDVVGQLTQWMERNEDPKTVMSIITLQSLLQAHGMQGEQLKHLQDSAQYRGQIETLGFMQAYPAVTLMHPDKAGQVKEGTQALGQMMGIGDMEKWLKGLAKVDEKTKGVTLDTLTTPEKKRQMKQVELMGKVLGGGVITADDIADLNKLGNGPTPTVGLSLWASQLKPLRGMLSIGGDGGEASSKSINGFNLKNNTGLIFSNQANWSHVLQPSTFDGKLSNSGKAEALLSNAVDVYSALRDGNRPDSEKRELVQFITDRIRAVYAKIDVNAAPKKKQQKKNAATADNTVNARTGFLSSLFNLKHSSNSQLGLMSALGITREQITAGMGDVPTSLAA